jgi:hypothetical protein
MRVGLIDVKDAGSWGPVSTDDGRCRRGHRYTPWEHRADEDEREVAFYRACHQCGWTFAVVPVISGPHRLNRVLGEFMGLRRIEMCLCGEVWPHKTS